MARASRKAAKQVTTETVDKPAMPSKANGGPTTVDPPVQAAGAQRPELTPEARTKIAQIRGRIETSVGQLVLLMMHLPRYRHQTLGDLNHLIVEPLLRDKVAIAYSKGEGEQPGPLSAPVGVAIWASVSDPVDATIREQIKAGVFPVRLAADDWASGEKLWLLDIVAVSNSAASAVLLNFRKIAGERRVQLHPFVSRTIDPELLKRLQSA